MSTPPNKTQAPPTPVWQDARLLEVHGATAADFLQGYLTCDTTRINAATATPMAICNVKGRVLASGWVIEVEQGVGLIVHVTLASAVAQFLKPYVTFSKCSLVPRDDLSLSVSQSPPGIELHTGLYLSAITSMPQQIDVSALMTDTLIAADFAFLSAEVSEKFLPQMLGLDAAGAVDFDKGCYLGQEIVARATFRGAVKRKLVRFQWRDHMPVIGDVWQDVGTVITVSGTGSGLALTKN